jgi:hypothetical protein
MSRSIIRLKGGHHGIHAARGLRWPAVFGDRFHASGLPAAARAGCDQLLELGIRTHEVPRATIATPPNASQVARTEMLTGRSNALPPGYQLWAVVSAVSMGRYHRQGGPLEVNPEGRFVRKVYIGLPESAVLTACCSCLWTLPTGSLWLLRSEVHRNADLRRACGTPPKRHDSGPNLSDSGLATSKPAAQVVSATRGRSGLARAVCEGCSDSSRAAITAVARTVALVSKRLRVIAPVLARCGCWTGWRREEASVPARTGSVEPEFVPVTHGPTRCGMDTPNGWTSLADVRNVM